MSRRRLKRQKTEGFHWICYCAPSQKNQRLCQLDFMHITVLALLLWRRLKGTIWPLLRNLFYTSTYKPMESKIDLTSIQEHSIIKVLTSAEENQERSIIDVLTSAEENQERSIIVRHVENVNMPPPPTPNPKSSSEISKYAKFPAPANKNATNIFLQHHKTPRLPGKMDVLKLIGGRRLKRTFFNLKKKKAFHLHETQISKGTKAGAAWQKCPNACRLAEMPQCLLHNMVVVVAVCVYIYIVYCLLFFCC